MEKIWAFLLLLLFAALPLPAAAEQRRGPFSAPIRMAAANPSKLPFSFTAFVPGFGRVKLAFERERRRELDEEGNWTGRFKMVTVRRVNKHVPGDTGAAYKWLQKRMPDRWGEQRESVYGETDQDGFLAALALSVGEAWADEGGEQDGDDESEE